MPLYLAVVVTLLGLAAPAGAGPMPKGKVVVPNVVHKRLDVAELMIRGRGLKIREVGGGVFGIVVKSNWIVCQTIPKAGVRVTAGSRVNLIVEHYSCS